MKNLLVTLSAIACVVCTSSTDCRADEFTFGDWTVTVTPTEPQPEQADAAEKVVRREYVVREVRETRIVQTQFVQPRYPYYGYGSNYSIYFPWRNYRGYGFNSYYRPRTIYNYGYGY